MTSLNKTRFQLVGDSIHYEGKPTKIRVTDDEFVFEAKTLNLYREDGKVFVLEPILPFMKWPRISSFTGTSIDEQGRVWAQTTSCVFDKYLEP